MKLSLFCLKIVEFYFTLWKNLHLFKRTVRKLKIVICSIEIKILLAVLLVFFKTYFVIQDGYWI